MPLQSDFQRETGTNEGDYKVNKFNKQEYARDHGKTSQTVFNIELTDKQKVKVTTMALERIKDAPVTEDEIQDTCHEALHLVHYGTYDFYPSAWGRIVLDVVCGIK